MAWRKAYSLDTILAEINALYPSRDKRTDGAISGYPGAQSSHNVNSEGVVCALDITTGDYPGGISTAQGQALAEQIRIACRDQPRGITVYPIHFMAPPYVAAAGPKIATAGTNWAWDDYLGSDLHTSHIHLSVDWDIFTGGRPSGLADYDLTTPWGLANTSGQVSDITPIEDDVALTLEDKLFIQNEMERRHAVTRQTTVDARDFLHGVLNETGDRVINNLRATIVALQNVIGQLPGGGVVDYDKVAEAVAAELGKKLAA